MLERVLNTILNWTLSIMLSLQLSTFADSTFRSIQFVVFKIFLLLRMLFIEDIYWKEKEKELNEELEEIMVLPLNGSDTQNVSLSEKSSFFVLWTGILTLFSWCNVGFVWVCAWVSVLGGMEGESLMGEHGHDTVTFFTLRIWLSNFLSFVLRCVS